MIKIKCLAVDDEPYALMQIVDFIEKTPYLELIDKSSNAFSAMEVLANNEVDLIFLDINLPELSGIELAKTISEKTKIIFTTAYSEYAVESYKTDAIDYLLKPITQEDFLRATNKALKLFQGKEPVNTNNDLQKDHFFVKSKGQFVKVNLQDIQYIESLSEYVNIYFTDQSSIKTLMSLKELETKLPKDVFMRVHRSFIVNLEKITTVERNRIIFNQKDYVPIGLQYKNEFKTFLENNFL